MEIRTIVEVHLDLRERYTIKREGGQFEARLVRHERGSDFATEYAARVYSSNRVAANATPRLVPLVVLPTHILDALKGA